MAGRGMEESILKRFLNRVPLTAKMLIVTVTVGVVAWGVLDGIQSRRLRAILHEELADRLEGESRHDREEFDAYVQSHNQVVRLYVAQRDFSEYVYNRLRGVGRAHGASPLVHTKPPAWLPRPLIMSAFMSIRYALLLDADGRVAEVFMDGPALPDAFLAPSALTKPLNHARHLITVVEGKPYLAAIESLGGEDGAPVAALMLVSPIDEMFFAAARISSDEGHVAALLSDSGDRVLASNDPGQIPAGEISESVARRYEAMGKSFFDYGASEPRMQFATFISRAEVERLGIAIFMAERRHRLYVAGVLVLSFGLIMMRITRRIDRMTRETVQYSEGVLGMSPKAIRRGDQLQILEKRYRDFIQEIGQSREALRSESEERIRQSLAAEQKEKESGLLRAVTESLGVGVLSFSEQGYYPANLLMKGFIECCGGWEHFVLEENELWRERTFIDVAGRKRVFGITRPDVSHAGRFFLVREVTEIKAAEERIRTLSRAVDQSSVMILITDTKGMVEYVNPKFTEVTGYGRDEILGKNVNLMKSGELSTEVFADLWTTILDGGDWHGELHNRKKNGDLYWELNSISPIRDSEGRVSHYLAIKEDVTERKRMLGELRVKETAIASSISAIAFADLGARLTDVNEAFMALWGFGARDEVLGRSLSDLWAEGSGIDAVIGEIGEKGRWLGELQGRRRDGAAFDALVSATLVTDDVGTPVCMMASFADITERKRMERRLREISVTDELTGLLNRRGFMALAGRQMRSSRRGDDEASLIYADLDGLKAINDALGHASGDAYIIEAADALRRTFRESDVICRVGGDEFAVLVLSAQGGGDPGDAILRRLEENIQEANAREGRAFKLSMSIGVVRIEWGTGEDLESLMRRADALMYETKKKKKGIQ